MSAARLGMSSSYYMNKYLEQSLHLVFGCVLIIHWMYVPSLHVGVVGCLESVWACGMKLHLFLEQREGIHLPGLDEKAFVHEMSFGYIHIFTQMQCVFTVVPHLIVLVQYSDSSVR